MRGRVRVFIATSLDGFIAGEHDDLSWLPETAEDHGYTAFMASVGVLLMGRRTYDVVLGFDKWLYERPVLVATTRPLPEPAPPDVRAVHGTIHELVEQALDAADGRDVYIDGGVLIRQALDAGLIDEMIVTIIPAILGRGIPLFAGASRRVTLQLDDSHAYPSGLVQLRYSLMRPA